MATLPNPLPQLAADPTGRALGLDLPPGTVVRAPEPLLWYADDAADPEDWPTVRSAARGAGLLPFLIDTGGSQRGPEEWELMPDEMSYPGDHDAEEVLADFWEEYAPQEADSDGWPGLAPAPARALGADPDTRAAEAAAVLLTTGWFKAPRLALAPARRSADLPAAIGWSGPLNHENDVARLCAVLRSWEDRFGLRVVALGFDRLAASVASPPATLAEAEAIAVEHYAFCPDTVDQGPGSLDDYAESLVDEGIWSFWWD
ncbi:DUF4253 domain-containing protein [Streptomyces sp. NPDC005423]|uniref:DUF4253 domain-containing protein n=1 Tax=Streptomyces sp. NPDC005423 TaxID=3155343 RepID=UPI0033B138C3